MSDNVKGYDRDGQGTGKKLLRHVRLTQNLHKRGSKTGTKVYLESLPNNIVNNVCVLAYRISLCQFTLKISLLRHR